MPEKYVAGADGIRGGWVCLTRDLRTGEVESRVFADAEALVFQRPTPAVLAIDVPIGLGDAYIRECDREAKTILRGRRSSVFPAPVRALLDAGDYAEACRASAALTGKKISLQAWNITPKIREVDRILSRDPGLQARVREAHPEVCFWKWNGERPMEHGKKSAAGRRERRALVERHFGADVYRDVRRRHPVQQVGHDDLLDAFAALWTAERIARGEAETLPKRPPRDPRGLRMEIVY